MRSVLIICGSCFIAEATHIVVGEPDLVKAVKGERLW